MKLKWKKDRYDKTLWYAQTRKYFFRVIDEGNEDDCVQVAIHERRKGILAKLLGLYYIYDVDIAKRYCQDYLDGTLVTSMVDDTEDFAYFLFVDSNNQKPELVLRKKLRVINFMRSIWKEIDLVDNRAYVLKTDKFHYYIYTGVEDNEDTVSLLIHLVEPNGNTKLVGMYYLESLDIAKQFCEACSKDKVKIATIDEDETAYYCVYAIEGVDPCYNLVKLKLVGA